MAFSLHLLPEAERDVNKALEWYGGPETDLGSRLMAEIAEALNKLENHPTYYRYFKGNHRRILSETFRYQIIYSVEASRVLIYAIYHTSRDDNELRKRLP